jgi:serine protease Do
MAKKVVLQLKEKGKVTRGMLGVAVARQLIDQDTQKLLNLKSKKGALIDNVTAGGPADKAGLKAYDVIVEINGQAIQDSNDLRMKIADIQPGSKVEIKIIRDGKEKTVTATIAELEEDRPKASAANAGKDVGLTVTPLTPNLARRYGMRTTRGLLITDVDSESDAARKGIQPGDVILEVNREIVATEAQWESVVGKKKSGDALLLRVRREADGQPQDFLVTIKIP